MHHKWVDFYEPDKSEYETNLNAAFIDVNS